MPLTDALKTQPGYTKPGRNIARVVFFVCNRFLAPKVCRKCQPVLRELRRSGTVDYGRFNSLQAALTCAKANPGACITRVTIRHGYFQFERYWGVELVPIAGKFGTHLKYGAVKFNVNLPEPTQGSVYTILNSVEKMAQVVRDAAAGSYEAIRLLQSMGLGLDPLGH